MTIDTTKYGTLRLIDDDELDTSCDNPIDFLDNEEVEIWCLSSGEIVAIESIDEEDCEEDWEDLECGFDPYAGCYSYDC